MGGMGKIGEEWRADFESAMGQTFAEWICPPVALEDASPHECCEVVRKVVGDDVTPTRLNSRNEQQIDSLAQWFGECFDCQKPTTEQIKDAIAHTLARWPIGSHGESA